MFKDLVLDVAITLYPSDLESIQSAILYLLNLKLMKYDQAIGGVLVSYRRVKLKQTSGSFVQHYVFPNLSVRLNATAFCPVIGASIMGVVHYVERTHLALLIYGLFNASISVEHIPKHYIKSDNTFVSKDDENDSITVGTELKFTVIAINRSAEQFSLEGTLLEFERPILKLE